MVRRNRANLSESPDSTDRNESEDPGFAPADVTDGREIGHWRSRWDPEAKRAIRLEAAYLCLLLLTLPVATILVWKRSPNEFLEASPESYRTFALYSYSVIGGVLGGVLFDLKWLYHSVAHGLWNIDRRLWRLFTPLISGGLAFAILLLATAGLLPLIDTESLRQPAAVMGLSFLVGYFSDNTIAAMARLASRLFGEHARHSKTTSLPSGGDEGEGPEPPEQPREDHG